MQYAEHVSFNKLGANVKLIVQWQVHQFMHGMLTCIKKRNVKKTNNKMDKRRSEKTYLMISQMQWKMIQMIKEANYKRI